MDGILTRYNVFNYLSNNIFELLVLERDIYNKLDFNLKMIVFLLDGVEDYEDEERKSETRELNRKNEKTVKTSMLYKKLKNNFEKAFNMENLNYVVNFEIIDSIRTLVFEEDDLPKTRYQRKKIIFNYLKLVNELSEELFKSYSDDIRYALGAVSIDDFLEYSRITNVNVSQIYSRGFLSYSYDDRFYTLGIFLIFFEKGILLYVDWIFNNEENNIEILKGNLDMILSKCQYFIFLRTLNSEMAMKGTRHIRQWCSWEIGKYYEYAVSLNGQKYFIDTFDANYETVSSSSLLGDFTSLKSIDQIY